MAHAQLGLGLAPMRVELRMAPGQEYSNTVKLSSQSGVSTRVRAEVLDFDIDETATPQFERNLPKEAPTSCKNWLSLNPMEMEIEKDGYLNVRYTIHLPEGLAEGSYNCAAGFTTLPAVSQEKSGVGLSMAVRIVAAFYVVVGKPEINGKLEEIKLEQVAATKDHDAGFQAIAVLNNSGRMYYRPTGTVDVLDVDGNIVESADFQSVPVLRERSQRFLFPIKTHLDPGQYKLRVRVDIGTSELQEGNADVTVDAAPVQGAQNGKR
ncbi:MAG: hypothetical protein DMG52_29780 [Acidobacteria bacterium]|nr:MAG: hypothetical protein DMG52_29780 [Acidobacteriota bacterium]